MSLVDVHLVGQQVARRDEPVTFQRMLAALELATAAHLQEQWFRLNKTRKAKAAEHIDFDFAILEAKKWIAQLAFIESVYGYKRTAEWLGDAGARADLELQSRAQQEGEAS